MKDFKNKDLKVPYTIVRSKRKTYGICVDAQGEVTLRIPLRGSERHAVEMALEKEDWILKTVERQKEKAKEREALEQEADSHLTKEQREGLERRYREAAREYFPKRASFYADMLGVSFERIRIGDQKTKWGSCSGRGTLSFNWRLMLAPPIVLDYVVVHEVCHLLHMNHSKAFWAQVEEVMPDYKQHRKWLRDNGHTLRV